MSVARDKLNSAGLLKLLGRQPPPPGTQQPLAVAALGGGRGIDGFKLALGNGATLRFRETPDTDGSVGWVMDRATTQTVGGTTTTTASRSWSDPVSGNVVRFTETVTDGTSTRERKSETWEDGTGTHSTWRETTTAGGSTTVKSSSMSVTIDPVTGEPSVTMVGPDGKIIKLTPSGLSINGGPPFGQMTVTGCVDGVNKSITVLGYVNP